ncbi:hypothetical protein ACFLYU_04370 [Candidatus Dependentiae bacterium]
MVEHINAPPNFKPCKDKKELLKKVFKSLSDHIYMRKHTEQFITKKNGTAKTQPMDYCLFVIDTDKIVGLHKKITKELDYVFSLCNDTHVSRFFANPNIYSHNLRKKWLEIDFNPINKLNLLDIILETISNAKMQYKNITFIKNFKNILVYAKLAQNKKLFRRTIHAAYILEILKKIVPGELAAQIIGFTGVETFAGKELISKKYRHKKEKKLKKKIKKTNSQDPKLCTIL